MAKKKIDFSDTYWNGPVDEDLPPIERLAPESDHHAWVLEQLTRRIKASETEMSKFYDRWRIQERKFQAYMDLPRYEQILKDMNDAGKPPAPAIIVFPYTYAAIATIVAYLVRNFCGRKPIFQLGTTSTGTADRVRLMETVLQYQADYQKMVAKLTQFFKDGELYGVTVMRNLWGEVWANRTTWAKPDRARVALGAKPGAYERRTELKRIYVGAEVSNIDPYMFFPDPTVPMNQCPREGEFIFCREIMPKHKMIQLEENGDLMWTEYVEPFQGGKDTLWYGLSNRNLLAGGSAHAGQNARRNPTNPANIFMFDQGTVRIIPAEWGLGESETPQLYLFGIINKSQIVQCVPLDFDHNDHPFVVVEPYAMGYGFGNPGLSDYLGPIQDIISWFIDSHIYNVRSVLNNQLVVDPMRVEIQDLKNPKAGKLIRLKASAIGQDVKSAIMQLPMQDVTRAHMSDLIQFMRIGDMVSAVSDNLRGIQQQGGRKSATEVRQSNEGGAFRLAGHAMGYSAQGISELARQMTLNTQQYNDEEQYLKVLGTEQMRRIGPLELMGDFVFPVHDGVLPLDRTAMLEIWERILTGVASDQELRMEYSFPKIFEFVAELGGAVNISSFRRGGGAPPVQFGIQGNPQENPNMVPINEVPLPEPRQGPTPAPGFGRAPRRLKAGVV